MLSAVVFNPTVWAQDDATGDPSEPMSEESTDETSPTPDGGDASDAMQGQSLAQAAQNPIAAMYSVPLQNNINFGIGPHERLQNVLNVQPVVPLSLGPLNLINRTIIPVIWQPDITETSGGTFGLGDILYQGFLTPARSLPVSVGVGPAVSFPSATNDVLGTGKWSLGPALIVLGMPGAWVIGAVAVNIWSVGGDSDRPDVNAFTLQYFINWNLCQGWYLTSSPIITANWEAPKGDQWIVPFGLGVGRVFQAGRQALNIQVGGYVNAIHPDTRPHADWQLRLQVTFLYPR
jgi:hypothetical protein